MPIALVGYDRETGRIDLAALEAAVTNETAAVLVQSPNFFGVIEDIPAIAEIAHAKGALLIVSIAEAVSLGVVRPPVEADIVSMEAQSFGVALSYGGPVLRRDRGQGAVRAADAGAARRADRRSRWEPWIRADALDARAAHPAREGHFEHLHQSGAGGADGDDLSDCLWEGRHSRTGGAQPGQGGLCGEELSAQPGTKLLFKGAPRFHEFVLETEESPALWTKRLLENKIVGGIELSRWYPELGNATLWCATEMVTREQIDTAAQVLAAGLVEA